MNFRAKLFSKASILPCIVVSFSLLYLFSQQVSVCAPGVYVAAAGLLAVVLYVFNVRFAGVLFFLWALVQLLVIKHVSSTGNVFAAADVWDVTQGVRLSIYFPVALGSQGYMIGFNLYACVLLTLMLALRPKSIVGSHLSFTAYRHDNSLGIVFPLKGAVEKRVTLSGENDWLLVNLQSTFTYNHKTICHVLIKRNDKLPVIKNQVNQLVFFKPVMDVNMIKDSGNNKLDFEEEVWALCK